MIHTLCKLSHGEIQAVLKHHNYPDSLGTAVLIKTKELTEDLWAAHKSGKGFKTISKCFGVPVATVQSIIISSTLWKRMLLEAKGE